MVQLTRDQEIEYRERELLELKVKLGASEEFSRITDRINDIEKELKYLRAANFTGECNRKKTRRLPGKHGIEFRGKNRKRRKR